ncbi:hypothetical protein HNQ81_002625 [Desulfoprunum benzoelyticum]|uniref:Uncharacterized protein n=1 Tax=Desulfoprunum benzoelyticum TaxID=1506996 RepID=A0A840UZK9_9BACT|nr:hypothetical protein [Desulfoprunum benzoelyticum]
MFVLGSREKGAGETRRGRSVAVNTDTLEKEQGPRRDESPNDQKSLNRAMRD